MRRLLGVLRDDGEAALAPQPGLADLDGLLERLRAAGLRVTLETSGSPVAVGSGAELTVYRLVQEALTNTLKHAGPQAQATVVAPSVTRRLLDAYAHRLPDGRAPATRAARLDPLTDRGREVLLAVAHGRSNAEIAERLVVSEATVKTHVGRILTKLGLRDRIQAVILAYETGLVQGSQR